MDRQGSDRQDSAAFSEFWLLYPRRVAKGTARRAHHAALRKASHATIQAGLTRFLSDLAARGTALQYIPHPATWLNGERWCDEMPQHQAGNGADGSAEDRGYARVIAGGLYLANVSDQRVARMVRAGLLTKQQALACGYRVE